jgi:hypothetical protein
MTPNPDIEIDIFLEGVILVDLFLGSQALRTDAEK